MEGLKPEDHGLLNDLSFLDSKRKKRKIYAEKRREYVDNPKALEEIDIYDGETEPYHSKINEYVESFKSHDEVKQKELEAWFKEHYPFTNN